MFNNLIESSSHVTEFKRRGSFLAFTTATYIVLFVITGVVSIYAYDAKLEEQNTEIVVLLPPREIIPEALVPKVIPDPIRDRANGNDRGFDIRRNPTATVDQPIAPEFVSTIPNPNPPVRPGVPVKVGEVDSNTAISGKSGIPSGTGQGVVQINIPDELPPAPAPTPAPKIFRVSEVLNGRATFLPKPAYPALAKQIRLQGSVTVQVLVDEVGKVISAKAISGHPLLVPESQRAATQARFSPTTINGQPVKISGVITYNFQLMQ